MDKSTYQKRTGHTRDKIVHKGNNIKAIRRRQTALVNLERTLSEMEAKDITELFSEESKDHSIKRIKKEIATLKSKL